MKDAAEEGDRVPGAPHPRSGRRLIGQEAAEAALLEAWRSRPDAPRLADRRRRRASARRPSPIASRASCWRPARRDAATLDAPADHPAVRRIEAQSNADLFVLRRVITPERTTLPTVIPVDEVRKTVGFLGSTAASGGWRVVIVDSLDELNARRRQRPAEEPGGAAAARAVPAHRPPAGPGAADHPLALPQADAAAAGRGRSRIAC